MITGLAFGYAGGATQHQLRKLEFVTPAGTLSGDLTLGAVSPFPLTANLALPAMATIATHLRRPM